MRITITPGQPDKQPTDKNAAKSLQSAQRNWDEFTCSMNIFQSNIQRRNFEEAEIERVRMHALLDDYIDNYSIAGKLALGEQK